MRKAASIFAIATAVMVMGAVVWITPKSPTPAEWWQCSTFMDNPVHQAVVDKLSRKIYPLDANDISKSGNYNPNHWNPLLDAEQAELTRITTWAKTLPDYCVRKNYIDSLDRYQRWLNEARKELASPHRVPDIPDQGNHTAGSPAGTEVGNV